MKKRPMQMKDVLARENTDCLKGVMALAIVAGHLRNAEKLMPFFDDTVAGMILTASGYLAVGVFFFLSAYGLRRHDSNLVANVVTARFADAGVYQLFLAFRRVAV